MAQTGSVPKDQLAGAGPALRLFTPTIRWLWVGLVVFTVVTEVVPIPLIPPVPFYTYKILKLLVFVAVGYIAPLAFWRFNALNRGIFLAAISAMLVETFQGLIRSGHSFHWYEMLLKLALILLGFSIALDGRYEQKIALGPFQIRLIGKHPDNEPLIK